MLLGNEKKGIDIDNPNWFSEFDFDVIDHSVTSVRLYFGIPVNEWSLTSILRTNISENKFVLII